MPAVSQDPNTTNGQMNLSGPNPEAESNAPDASIGTEPLQSLQPPAQPASSIVNGKPSVFSGLLKGALLGGVKGALAGASDSPFAPFQRGMAQANQQAIQQKQQAFQNQIEQEAAKTKEENAQSLETQRNAQAQRYQAQAAKAMADKLHVEALTNGLGEQAQAKISKVFADELTAYKKAGYDGVEIQDTWQDRNAYIQQLKENGVSEMPIFVPDPQNGKIIALTPDPTKTIKADDAVAIGKSLGIDNMPHIDYNPRDFDALVSQHVKIMAQQESLKATQIKANAGITEKKIGAAATIGAAQIGANSREAVAGIAAGAGGANGANGAQPGASGNPLIDAVGQGKLAPDRLGYLLTRNPQLLQQVVKYYPDFDSTKAASYVTTYKEFTSTKQNTAGGALRAGATAMGHLAQLYDLVEKPSTYMPGTDNAKSASELVQFLGGELAKFYGTNNVTEVEALKKAIGSGFPWQKIQAVKTAVHAMGVQFDNYEQQWKNAAPSKAYEAPMPNVSDQTKAIRATLDPEYAQRMKQEEEMKGAPQGATMKVPGSDGKMHWSDGKQDLGVAQ